MFVKFLRIVLLTEIAAGAFALSSAIGANETMSSTIAIISALGYIVVLVSDHK